MEDEAIERLDELDRPTLRWMRFLCTAGNKNGAVTTPVRNLQSATDLIERLAKRLPAAGQSGVKEADLALLETLKLSARNAEDGSSAINAKYAGTGTPGSMFVTEDGTAYVTAFDAAVGLAERLAKMVPAPEPDKSDDEGPPKDGVELHFRILDYEVNGGNSAYHLVQDWGRERNFGEKLVAWGQKQSEYGWWYFKHIRPNS
jgi:hypothetical protein